MYRYRSDFPIPDGLELSLILLDLPVVGLNTADCSRAGGQVSSSREKDLKGKKK